jgi:sugar/nucleoside kinase (ribokinase family)
VSPPELAVVGEAFEDLVFYGLPRLPRPGEELRTERFLHTVGGGVVITGLGAARLGLRTVVVSALSPAAVEMLSAARVALVDLRRRHEPPAVSVALSVPGDRSFVTFEGVNRRLEARLARAIPRLRARHVHLALGPTDATLWVRLLRRLHARGVTTSLDAGWQRNVRAVAALAAQVDYVMLNEREAMRYSGRPTLAAAVTHWKGHARNAIIKLGPRGSRWVSEQRDLSAPAPRVAVVDTTGAGDAYNAGFLFGVLRRRSPTECLRLGNFVGAMSTRAAGGVGSLPGRRDLPRRRGRR